jgi:8-oxo-dGTP pyrophosphatase MutT (NUDIX family)
MMADLQRFHAKICFTAAAWLLHEEKVLLVHHKKLNIWLAPGGHTEEQELPHQTAEREMWEEAGIRVKAISQVEFSHGKNTSNGEGEAEFLPTPFASNLHWVCKENYWLRQGIGKAEDVPEGWRRRGCEQHLGMCYMVYPTNGVEFRQNTEETLGIGWFSLDELENIDTLDKVREEAQFVFEHYPRG